MRRLGQAPPAPFFDGRKSVASRAHTNMRATTEGAEVPRSGNSLPRRSIALRHFPRPCAGSRKHRRPRLSMVENRSRRAPTPIRMQRPRGPEILRSGNSLRRRAIALGHFPRPCCMGGPGPDVTDGNRRKLLISNFINFESLYIYTVWVDLDRYHYYFS